MYREQRSALPQEDDILPAGRVSGGLLVGLLVAAVLTLAGVTLSRGRAYPEREFPPRSEVDGVLQRLFDKPSLASIEAARAHQQLDSYGWVDRDARVVRIPIDRAMKLVAEGKRP